MTTYLHHRPVGVWIRTGLIVLAKFNNVYLPKKKKEKKNAATRNTWHV